MKSFKHQDCVKILQCNVFEKNLAQGRSNTNCWEMARQTQDDRFMYNICQDCIVYLFEHEEGVFTENEMEQILSQRKVTCHSNERAV